MESFREWFQRISAAHPGELFIPLQWIPDWIGITRMAVHSAIRKERIQSFIFVSPPFKVGVLGNIREPMRESYTYCLLSECEEWRQELENRKKKKEQEKQ